MPDEIKNKGKIYYEVVNGKKAILAQKSKEPTLKQNTAEEFHEAAKKVSYGPSKGNDGNFELVTKPEVSEVKVFKKGNKKHE